MEKATAFVANGRFLFSSTCIILIAALQAYGADPIRNVGQPMSVPFHCTEDDMAQAGLTCSAEAPCPVYLELTSVATIGTKTFVAGNLHTEAATLYSVLLESDDSGESWTEPVERTRGAGFDLIQFPDFEHGWVAGELLQPLARDPFFLITSDGAKTWRKRPIFDDGTGGSVQSFWFDSSTHGYLVLDKGSGDSRYQLFESPTGGDTWTIRESSPKPIRIKTMPPAGSSGWRLRAEARAKAFRVEKSEGNSWKPIASFLISAGACKPEESPNPEAPK